MEFSKVQSILKCIFLLFYFFCFIFLATKVYSVAPKMDKIMSEIYTNGPVVAAMKVYEDFLNYKGGKYNFFRFQIYLVTS